jgi:glycosyltransferase involved in cell wall biosynthesis
MNLLTDKFICVSEALKNQLPEPLHNKSITVHNGLNSKNVLARGPAREWIEQKFNFDTQSKILLTVGNFIPEKGHRFLLPIAKHLTQKYQKVKFLWIGRHDFSYRSIQDEIAQMGLQTTFICPGQIDNIGHYMAGADLYLLPSETEAFPTVLLEARLARLPFIARDCGGAKEIAERGGGTCTPLNDAAAFESEIIKTLETPSRFSDDLPENFTMKQMKQGYQSAYDDLIERGVDQKKLQQREACLNQLLNMEQDLRFSYENQEKLHKLFKIKGVHRLLKWWVK